MIYLKILTEEFIEVYKRQLAEGNMRSAQIVYFLGLPDGVDPNNESVKAIQRRADDMVNEAHPK